jgi:hypothetical protein
MDNDDVKPETRPKPKFCCFCQFSGPERSYRNVGTKDHEDDLLCNLCDTKVD